MIELIDYTAAAVEGSIMFDNSAKMRSSAA